LEGKEWCPTRANITGKAARLSRDMRMLGLPSKIGDLELALISDIKVAIDTVLI
jgi:hypothetical protein